MTQPAIVQTPGEPSAHTLRFLLHLGHALLIALLGTWALFLYRLGKPYNMAFAVAVSQLFGGRAMGVGLGFSKGLSPMFMFFQVAMVDFILMLYIYPIFVRGYQHLTKIPVIGSYLSNLHGAALRHKKRMAPYGAIGLMAFVLFPFWSTGCVVGAIVGYLIGLPTWLSLSSVTLGNLAAIAAWIMFYDRLTEWNESAAQVALGIVIAVFITGLIISRVRRFYNPKKDADALETKVIAKENASSSISEEDTPKSSD